MASVSVDFDANAMYVSLSKNKKKVKETIPLGEDRFIDIAKDGTVIGVEILFPKEMSQKVKEIFLRSRNEIKILQ